MANDKYYNSRSGLAPYSVMDMPDTLISLTFRLTTSDTIQQLQKMIANKILSQDEALTLFIKIVLLKN